MLDLDARWDVVDPALYSKTSSFRSSNWIDFLKPFSYLPSLNVYTPSTQTSSYVRFTCSGGEHNDAPQQLI